MSDKNQQVKFTYQGPWAGVDTSLPETDIQPNSSPFISNCILRTGELRSRMPFTPLFAAPNDGTAVRSLTCMLDVNAVVHTIAISQLAIYQLSANWPDMLRRGTNPWLVLANFSSAQADSPFALAILQAQLYFTNGGNAIFNWNGLTNTIQNIASLADGTVFGAFYLMELNSKLVAAYISETKNGVTNSFPYRVRWTASAQPTAWDVTTNIAAGFTDMFDVSDIITGMLPIGRTGYIYRTNGITEMIPNSSGGGFDFDHLWASDRGIGNILPQSIAGFGPMNIFVSGDEIYQITPSGLNGIGKVSLNAIKSDLANAAGTVMGTIVPYMAQDYVYTVYMLIIPFDDQSAAMWLYDIKEQSWTRWRTTNKTFTCKPRYVYLQ